MKEFNFNESYFNGKLHSLKYLCNEYGVDVFSLEYNFKMNRVIKLYNSNLDNNHYIEKILLSDEFNKDFEQLLK